MMENLSELVTAIQGHLDEARLLLGRLNRQVEDQIDADQGLPPVDEATLVALMASAPLPPDLTGLDRDASHRVTAEFLKEAQSWMKESGVLRQAPRGELERQCREVEDQLRLTSGRVLMLKDAIEGRWLDERP